MKSINKIKSILILAILLLFSPTLWSQSSDRVYILCYHTYLGKANIVTDFSLEEFRTQLQSIKDLGYTFVSWQDIASNKVTGSKNVLITIDDGNKTVVPAWDQVLKPMSIKPILFIYPAIIGRMHYAMKFSQLQDLQKQGVTIGAHGYYHEYVTTKLFKRSPKDFWREIKTSKSLLEKYLALPVVTFAYPYGAYDSLTLSSIEQSKYQYGFKLGNVPQALPLPTDGNRYLLTRYLMTRGGWKRVYRKLKEETESSD